MPSRRPLQLPPTTIRLAFAPCLSVSPSSSQSGLELHRCPESLLICGRSLAFLPADPIGGRTTLPVTTTGFHAGLPKGHFATAVAKLGFRQTSRTHSRPDR